ncbi:MAG: DUF2804 domain-containing protein [Anaerolineales bacterium]
MQNELVIPGPLLDENGNLNQVGWSRQQLLDCNLEDARFYRMKFLQKFRIKRWDYYAVFTPRRFFSATIADLGYAGNIFVYTIDFETLDLHEEGIVVPFGKDILLPRNSSGRRSYFANQDLSLEFIFENGVRRLLVSWPGFDSGKGIEADISLSQPESQQTITIVIPIGKKRFYYNTKINCLPASGTLRYGELNENLTPDSSLGSLDWGRGVWEYSSFWQWASASGFRPDGRTVGLNLGGGFGDTSQATENCVFLDGVVHKLDQVAIDYDPGDYTRPWRFSDNQGRLELDFQPFKERAAVTRLGIIDSEVHQMFGRDSGFVVSDGGQRIEFDGLVGFAEDHKARW